MKRYEEILEEKGYTIDKNGVIYNKNGEEVKGGISNGYKVVSLKVDGVKRRVKFHRFQAYTKYGKKLFEDGIVVRHLNNNKMDNSWDNIAIGTSQDNSMDNPPEERMEYAIAASKVHNKYKKEFVEKIRKERSSGASYAEIIAKYGIPKSSLSHIINNKYKVH